MYDTLGLELPWYHLLSGGWEGDVSFFRAQGWLNSETKTLNDNRSLSRRIEYVNAGFGSFHFPDPQAGFQHRFRESIEKSKGGNMDGPDLIY